MVNDELRQLLDERGALRTLLDGDRMRAYADAARDFRIEGMIYLPITNEPPGAVASGRFDCLVAGGRSVRVPTRRISRVPWVA